MTTNRRLTDWAKALAPLAFVQGQTPSMHELADLGR